MVAPSPSASDPGDVDEAVDVYVIGRRQRALDHVPGSAFVIDEEALTQQGPTSAHEALRTILLLEDGVRGEFW